MMSTIVRALIRTRRMIIRELRQLQLEVKHMADEVAHLTDAVTAITTAVTEAGNQIKAETAKILELVANPTGVDPVSVEAAAQSISALASGLHDAVTAAQSALNPPAPAPVVDAPAPADAPPAA